MSFAFKVDGQWNGEDVKLRGRKVVGKSAFETGLVVESNAKALTPVKTGRLRGSITTQSANRGTEISGKAATDGIAAIEKPRDPLEVLVGTAVNYAAYVEFGTRFTGAQPYLRPGLALARGEVLTIAIKNGKSELAEYLNR